MAKQGKDYDRWVKAAAETGRTDNPLKVPYDIAVREAVAAAAFVKKYWEPDGDRPGLKRVKNRLPASSSDDLLSIIHAVQEAQTRLLLIVDPAVANLGERARFVVDELESALEFLLDDDVDEPADAQSSCASRSSTRRTASTPAPSPRRSGITPGSRSRSRIAWSRRTTSSTYA
ncbi:hypothetical protein [Sorangium sp. So ce1000]|uniref:hypothetical protein n=1 Tax=Sorangium sp. So ce1000 TaxID=3133325 RepID=UPI003F63616C